MYDRIYRRKPPSDSLRTSLRRITSSLSFAREDRSWSVFLFALLSPCRGLLILARFADVSIARSRRLIFRFRILCVGFLGLWGVSFVYKRLTNKKRETILAILYAAFVGNWLRERIHFRERRRGGGFLLSYAKMNRRCTREFLPCICKRVFIRCTVNNLTHTHTHTHSMYTRYRYQLLLLLLLLYSTATIITIIGCLSIRLTPSSGPNYYVTIFIDNKGRNKHWSKIIVIKKKKKRKKDEVTPT